MSEIRWYPARTNAPQTALLSLCWRSAGGHRNKAESKVYRRNLGPSHREISAIITTQNEGGMDVYKD